MRRKKGALVPLELSILAACLDLKLLGVEEAHGFLIAKQIGDQSGARMLTAHGTMYKALGRMERTGLLKSRWEDPALAASESRPRRRFYRVTAQGAIAFDASTAHNKQPSASPKRITT
jgi:DNA-binding PadR family transcriptional regulator